MLQVKDSKQIINKKMHVCLAILKLSMDVMKLQKMVACISITTILGVPTTPIVIISSVRLLFKFLVAKTPLDPLPKFVGDLISSPPLTTFVMSAQPFPTPMVVMTTIGD
jgi:hypothetical protein